MNIVFRVVLVTLTAVTGLSSLFFGYTLVSGLILSDMVSIIIGLVGILFWSVLFLVSAIITLGTLKWFPVDSPVIWEDGRIQICLDPDSTNRPWPRFTRWLDKHLKVTKVVDHQNDVEAVERWTRFTYCYSDIGLFHHHTELFWGRLVIHYVM
jgi:hypothetical protein